MISVIIQAREDSTRLPIKIFKKIIDSENSLSLILKRLSKSKKINKVKDIKNFFISIFVQKSLLQ